MNGKKFAAKFKLISCAISILLQTSNWSSQSLHLHKLEKNTHLLYRTLTLKKIDQFLTACFRPCANIKFLKFIICTYTKSAFSVSNFKHSDALSYHPAAGWKRDKIKIIRKYEKNVKAQ